MQGISMQRDHREQLQQSWQANADAWAAAVREQRIESRRLVTDAAIIQAVLALQPKRVLDIGCGRAGCAVVWPSMASNRSGWMPLHR